MAGWTLLAAPQALALAGLGDTPPDWRLQIKSPPLPFAYLLAVLAGSLLFVWGPFLYECWRCIAAQRALAANTQGSAHRLPAASGPRAEALQAERR